MFLNASRRMVKHIEVIIGAQLPGSPSKNAFPNNCHILWSLWSLWVGHTFSEHRNIKTKKLVMFEWKKDQQGGVRKFNCCSFIICIWASPFMAKKRGSSLLKRLSHSTAGDARPARLWPNFHRSPHWRRHTCRMGQVSWRAETRDCLNLSRALFRILADCVIW